MLSEIPQNLNIKKFNRRKKPLRPIAWLRKKMNWINFPFISAYRGYGNKQMIHVKGHVFKSVYWISERKTKNIFVNGLRMLKRFLMSPMVEAKVELQIGKNKHVTTTNDRGFYKFDVPNPGYGFGWHDYRVRLLDLDEAYEDEEIKVVEEILIPSPTGCALISDIDDTFIVSHSTSLFRKLYNLLTKNVETRRIFKGVVDHYQLLMNGQSRVHSNPFFYVSSSEWNLYDFIVEFCELNELPRGVFLLQDLKSGFRQLLKQSGGDHRHKEIKIIEILEKYPEFKVVLLGDSGQRDPEIYRSIAARYPDRVSAIYIRDVRKRSRRRKKVKQIGQNLKDLGVELIYFKNSSKAIEHTEEKLFGQQ